MSELAFFRERSKKPGLRGRICAGSQAHQQRCFNGKAVSQSVPLRRITAWVYVSELRGTNSWARLHFSNKGISTSFEPGKPTRSRAENRQGLVEKSQFPKSNHTPYLAGGLSANLDPSQPRGANCGLLTLRDSATKPILRSRYVMPANYRACTICFASCVRLRLCGSNLTSRHWPKG